MNTHVHFQRLRALRFAAVLSAVLALPACSDATGLNRPGGIGIAAGDDQALVVGARSQPLRVVVVDEKDQPLAGVVVFWSVVDGSGAVSAPTAFTDADGASEIIFTAGGTPGAAHIRAMVVSLDPVEFNVTVDAAQQQ